MPFGLDAFSRGSVIDQAGDVMQQLPHSDNGLFRLSQAAWDAKGSSESQQVRHKSS